MYAHTHAHTHTFYAQYSASYNILTLHFAIPVLYIKSVFVY